MDQHEEISGNRKEAHAKLHIGQAATAGTPAQETLETAEVAMEMGGGPATASARFALDVMDSVSGE